MVKYTGYGKDNAILNELEELKQSAQLRANTQGHSDVYRATAQGAADAYAYCILRIIQK